MIVHRHKWEAREYDGVLEPGMVMCVEAYVSRRSGGEGVKLEDQMLITETGNEILTTPAMASENSPEIGAHWIDRLSQSEFSRDDRAHMSTQVAHLVRAPSGGDDHRGGVEVVDRHRGDARCAASTVGHEVFEARSALHSVRFVAHGCRL